MVRSRTPKSRTRKGPATAELEHVPIRSRSIGRIRPSPENERLYRPVDPTDSEVVALAQSIRNHGIQEPLVVTQDGWILSGHRRHVAARLAGLKAVPCRFYPMRRDADPDRFVLLLREFNRQRVKTRDELLREEVICADPEEAYQSLIAHRTADSAVDLTTIELRGTKRRAKISPAKLPFLEAVQAIIDGWRKYWPLSDRRIHYALLNSPPLIHARKPDSTYENAHRCYKALVDLLTRARVAGLIPIESIADETRPVTVWDVHQAVPAFLRRQLEGFLKRYWRDLMQSQPNHVEIVAEKNTVAPIVKPIAGRYCIPLTIGRGFCSLPPRYAIAKRFERSGKERLILLILSDFDPDGEEIAHSLARSLRDDLGIDQVEAVKVTLTADQVARFGLPPKLEAKEKSANYKRFVRQHGNHVFELEALPPETLQKLLTEAIDAVIDRDAFNHEIDQEKRDAAFLEAVRRRVHQELGQLIDGEQQA